MKIFITGVSGYIGGSIATISGSPLEGTHFAFGANATIRSHKARKLLGWMPNHSSAILLQRGSANDWLDRADL